MSGCRYKSVTEPGPEQVQLWVLAVISIVDFSIYPFNLPFQLFLFQYFLTQQMTVSFLKNILRPKTSLLSFSLLLLPQAKSNITDKLGDSTFNTHPEFNCFSTTPWLLPLFKSLASPAKSASVTFELIFLLPLLSPYRLSPKKPKSSVAFLLKTLQWFPKDTNPC